MNVKCKSLFEKGSNLQKANNKRGPFAVHTAGLSNSGGDGTREVKPPIAPSSELGVSSGPECEDGWGKESDVDADVECLCCASLFCVRTTTMKNGFDTKMSEASTHSENCRKWACVCGRCKK